MVSLWLGAVFAVIALILARLVALEKQLKGYRGDGTISLFRDRFWLRPHYCVRLPALLSQTKRTFSLQGLPRNRYYTVALVLPSDQGIEPSSLPPFYWTYRDDNVFPSPQGADVSLNCTHTTGHSLCRFPSQPPLSPSAGSDSTLHVEVPCLDKLRLSAPPYLLVTSQPL